jgi:hypothetical protein
MSWRWVTRTAAAAVAGVTTGALMLAGTVAPEPMPALESAPNLAKMRLVTNEHAYRHAGDDGVRTSPQWLVTSGSLFGTGTFLWSGVPDGGAPGPRSSPQTGSAVLRAVTVDDTYTDVDISFDLRVNNLTRTARTPSQDYDGVHVSLRYQNERLLYYVSVFRRDGVVAVKKKVPGGPSNGGTYSTLASDDTLPRAGLLPGWRHVEVSIVGVTEVLIELRIDGRRVLSATEKAADAPIVWPGRVGIRGDNCDFYLRNFRVARRST